MKKPVKKKPEPKFKSTPGLRAEVMKCCKKLKDEGYEFRRNSYVNKGRRWNYAESKYESYFSCCAIGAISICASSPRSHRDGAKCFALSLKHLGCTPWELESIEAGFEGWARPSRELGASGAKASTEMDGVEPRAYKIGEEIYRRFARARY